MTDKEQIKELMLEVPQTIIAYDGNPKGQHLYSEQREQIAEALYNAGYRKVSKEAQEMVSNALVYSKRLKIEKSAEQVRKDTAKEILQKIKGRANWFLESQIQEDHFVEQIKELAEEYGVEIEE